MSVHGHHHHHQKIEQRHFEVQGQVKPDQNGRQVNVNKQPSSSIAANPALGKNLASPNTAKLHKVELNNDNAKASKLINSVSQQLKHTHSFSKIQKDVDQLIKLLPKINDAQQSSQIERLCRETIEKCDKKQAAHMLKHLYKTLPQEQQGNHLGLLHDCLNKCSSKDRANFLKQADMSSKQEFVYKLSHQLMANLDQQISDPKKSIPDRKEDLKKVDQLIDLLPKMNNVKLNNQLIGFCGRIFRANCQGKLADSAVHLFAHLCKTLTPEQRHEHQKLLNILHQNIIYPLW
jgi:hypothetical protein